ncbi:unnamed protein product [Onchocerca flexuosa]|uniref:Uncharacterized protein n=1 Tax=Onchocerca flexuosa TaxID=387005 RepID=A0A183I740_9BILA|nr:unnamed protein product [Onchocerca flexuosa]
MIFFFKISEFLSWFYFFFLQVQKEEGERTPLYGAAPAWWGENDDASDVQQQVRNDGENMRLKSAQRMSSSTAFTVSFDGEENSQKVNLSLQDAAKKTSSRRFMRKNMPATGLVSKGTAAKIAGLTAASSDPKQYLLNKMLMGIGEGRKDINLKIYLF